MSSYGSGNYSEVNRQISPPSTPSTPSVPSVPSAPPSTPSYTPPPAAVPFFESTEQVSVELPQVPRFTRNPMKVFYYTVSDPEDIGYFESPVIDDITLSDLGYDLSDGESNMENTQRFYSDGSRISGNFPAAYQESSNEEVPDGQKCSNCKFFNQQSGYCSKWLAAARSNFWCAAYQPIMVYEEEVSTDDVTFSLRDNNNKLRVFKKGSIVSYDGELYEVNRNVFGEIPTNSSAFSQITNTDNVVDGGSFGEEDETPTPTPILRRSSGSSSSGSGGGY